MNDPQMNPLKCREKGFSLILKESTKRIALRDASKDISS